MNKNKKITLIISIVLVSILLIVGVSYAVMNYNRIGSNHQVVLGDIWMSYEESTALIIEDAVPGSDYSNYFEFTISGKNTYTKKDIYYDFSLVRGDLPEGKTEDNRIPDKYLKFKLVSVDSNNQETVIFTDETYESLENQRIHVETIKKNTENKINRKYRLYMTIDNSLEIGNLETAVFTLDEWASAFASVKLNVTGDFIEKKIFLYDDCFRTNTLSDGTLEIAGYYTYIPNSSNELYQNPLCTKDVVIPSEIDGISVTTIGWVAFKNNDLTSIEIPDSVTAIGWDAFENNDLTSIEIPDSVISIGDNAFQNNQLMDIEIPDSVISIGNAAFNNNKLPNSKAYIYARTDNNNDGIAEIDNTTIVSYGGLEKDIVIPNGVISLTMYSFINNSLTSVILPNTLRTIGSSAFEHNNLTSIIIPNDVSEVGWYAFGNNYLTKIVLESRNLHISNQAFATHGASYAGNNMITKVINKSGREFNWDYIFGLEANNGNNTFATGTYQFYYNGDQTIEITDVED